MKKEKNLHSGHRERLRSQYIKNGFFGLHSHQLLELLLYLPIKRKDTNPIAHDLINTFGSLPKVFDADPHELEKVEGVGSSTAVYLKALLAIYSEYGADPDGQRITLEDSRRAFEYYSAAADFSDGEQIIVTALDDDDSSAVFNASVTLRGDSDKSAARRLAEIFIRLDGKKCALAHCVSANEPDVEREKALFSRIVALAKSHGISPKLLYTVTKRFAMQFLPE